MSNAAQNQIRLRAGLELELSECMRNTLRRWVVRQLPEADLCRLLVDAAIAHNDPVLLRQAIAEMSDLTAVQRRHASALIDTWEKSLG